MSLGVWYEANTGGPMSRTRTESVRSSILGSETGSIRCPRVVRVGLAFHPKADPVRVIERIARQSGLCNGDQVKAAFAAQLPVGSKVVIPVGSEPDLEALHADAFDVLFAATVLGLCTATFYDPSRSILWTRTSLTRHLELYDTGGFYALD